MSFMVLLDHPDKCHMPGEQISGKVQFTVTVPDYIEIWVKIIGEERAYPVNRCKSRRTDLNTSNRACFLWTENYILKSEYMNEGQYELNFKVMAPNGIPSSYIDKYGDVSYFIKGCMCRCNHEKFGDLKRVKIFSPINLNTLDAVWMSPKTYLSESSDSRLSFWGSPHMEIKLEKAAFVPGDTINVLVVLKKKPDISAITLNLIMEVKMNISDEEKEFMSAFQTIASDYEFLEEDHGKKTRLFCLKIPDALEVPNFVSCTLFSHTTLLEVVGTFRDTSKSDLKIDAKIMLGHLPIHQPPTLFEGSEGIQMEEPQLSASSSELNITPSAPPASFQESVPPYEMSSVFSGEEASGFHVPKPLISSDGIIDLPPSYEEALLMNESVMR